MSNLLNGFKKMIIEQWLQSISSNTSYYYAFAANPVSNDSIDSSIAKNDKENYFGSNYYMLFGKKLTNTNILPLTRKIEWESNTIYDRYDDTSNTLDVSDFFVVVPADPGYYRHVFKCIDNANGSPSTQPPNLLQTTAFTKSDGYTWKYMYSISDLNYSNFATDDYIPITANVTVQATAGNTTGIDIIQVSNSGTGYICYHNGIIRSVVNSTVIQIESTASIDNEFYKNNGIYIYNDIAATAQLKTITQYVSNLSGNWVYLDSPANTTNIIPSVSEYNISPAVIFNVDSVDVPSAYSVVNTTSNSISNVVIIETGSNITRASAIIQSNTIYGTDAELHCIVSPPGGHGFDPLTELGVEAIGITFSFSGTESNTITTNAGYNRIGIIKNPYILEDDLSKGSLYTEATFNQLLIGEMSPNVAFANNEIITGQTSGAVGILAYLDGDVIAMIGDKHFVNNELIVSANNSLSTTLLINTYGQIYTTDLTPLYTQNVEDVSRANNQSETYKIVIKV